jgi:hypothetical protein
MNFTSRYGQTFTVGKKPTNGTDFSFVGQNGDIPTCLYGGYLPKSKGTGFAICHLGCEMIPSW